MTPFLKLDKVVKRYGSVPVIHGVSLEAEKGEFVVFVGPSGCGKSTLLRMIAGLEDVTDGDVYIDGRDVTDVAPADRQVSMVFQSYALYPHMSVFENIAFGLRMKKLQQLEVERRVNRTAELMHIEQLLRRYSGQLSGGQRQRVAVARALAMEPDVILMDEPLSNLDALLRLEMRAELKGVLAASKTTTIYVTHDQVEAMSLADRIAVMHQGRIVQAASPVEVYRNPAARFVGSFIGNPPMNFIPATKGTNGSWNVAGLTLHGPKSDRQAIDFAIRPEDVETGNDGLEATVRVVEPLGPHTLVTCDVAGGLFRAVLESSADVKVGDRLRLAPKPDRIRWFDPETTAALS
jgi:multiple sugar transport system ATP-binding protein